MSGTLSERIREKLYLSMRDEASAEALKRCSAAGQLAGWTRTMTGVVVNACTAMGWRASAKAFPASLLPVDRSEYLGLDVVAFPGEGARWRFPVFVAELENHRRDDMIAYAFWKILCVGADMRILFCYRRDPEDGPALIRRLRDEVVEAMGLDGRLRLEGETLVVVGSRSEVETFPYGFFTWWRLDINTGAFERL